VQNNGDMTKFHKYVFQKLTWRLIDMLRQEKRYFDFHSLEEFDFQRVPEESVAEKLDFVNFSELTKLDFAILQDHFIEGHPFVILSKRYIHTSTSLSLHRDRLLNNSRHMSAL